MDKFKIVIADDEALIRLDIKEILLEAGHEVIGEASNGQEALDLIRELKPDLAILDVKMPVMDGLAVAKVVNTESIAPVLLLTAYSQKEIVEEAQKSGVFAYLVKPVREEQLFPSMQIAISRFQEMQTLCSELGDLKDVLETRKIVERAKGILMESYKLTEDEAYKKLRQYAMNKRLSLKQVAQAVVKSKK